MNTVNKRRGELIDKKIDGTITDDEREELKRLQAWIEDELDRETPIPMDELMKAESKLAAGERPDDPKPHESSDIEGYVRQAVAKQYVDQRYDLLLNGTGEVVPKRSKLRVSQLRITQEMLDDCVVEIDCEQLLVNPPLPNRERDPFDVSSKTDQEIVDEANGLAAQFYKAHGYEVPEGYKFHEATHPHEISMWNMAVLAYEYLTGTDLNDALSGIEDEEDDQ